MELYPICDETLTISSSLWYSVSSQGESPSMRVGHTIIHIKEPGSSKGKLYIIGGANPSECFNDIYTLDLNTLQWDKFTHLEQFSARYEHACFKSNKEILIFAGGDQQQNYDDIVAYDYLNNKCRIVELKGAIKPTARTYHNGIAYKDQLVVFGGGNNGKQAVEDSKIYLLNPNNQKWIQLSIKGPSVRHGHVLFNYNDELIYLHGGMNNDTIYSDLWVLNLKQMSWTQLVTDSGPSSRAAHGGVCINKSLYLFGGISPTGSALDDLWKYDIELNKWELIDPFGYKPPCRLDFAYCKIELNDSKQFFMIHGGMDTEGNIFDDCFIIQFD